MYEKEREEVFLYGHKLPAPDQNFCSQCRKSIIHSGPGRQNVVKINGKKEKILNTKGQELGVEGKQYVKAWFHAPCFQEIADKRGVKGRIECKYCGILSMAKTLQDGSYVKDRCKCSCHDGAKFCSLLIE